MSNKKLTIKRLIIFIVISFVPFWVIVPIMNSFYGEPIYVSEEAAAGVYALGVFGMLIPSIANLITRLVTKEGFKNSYLGINFKGNAKYYIASVLVKVIEVIVCVVLIWAVFINDLSFSEAFPFDNMNIRMGTFLLQLSSAIIVFFPAFGEEWGWRGYMMPKLTELMGKPAAIITGGIIWGLWHAPLTVSGHNFGVDYNLYPWLGIVVMCLNCIFFNAFLTLLTEKTKSIYPASFCHMVNNSIGGGIFISMFGSEALAIKYSELLAVDLMLTVALIPAAVVGIISFIILMRDKKQA